jgi:uncharacterized membrane protein YeiH
MPILPSVTALLTLDLAAVAVFAITGALTASRKQMDVFGFALLGTVTGIGGGTVRDLLLGLPVFWVREPTYLVVCLIAATLTFFTAHLVDSRYRLVLWLDAVGLAAVAVIGADKALDHGASALVAVTMGVITGAFGGIIRDVLGGESPLVLRRDVYVTAALLAAIVYVAAIALGLSPAAASGAGFASGFALRGLAIHYRLSLPVYRPRRARSPEELGL